MTHPAIKITYWPFAGRTTAARLALTYAGIPYEFDVVNPQDWETAKQDHVRFPTEDMPVFNVNGGRTITQSAALTHYAGQLTGLWPTDPVNAAVQLEVMANNEEILTSFFGTCLYKVIPNFNAGVPEEELTKRAENFKEHFKFYAGRINDIINANSNKNFTVGDSLTVADFTVWQLPQFGRSFGISVDDLDGIKRVVAMVNAINKPGFNELRDKFAES